VVTPEQTEALSQLRRSAILTDEDWESFRENFDKVHTGFLIRLKAKIPDLSPAETRFLALAKLQLSNKEMAALLGVTADAMRLTRFRLRKKLNLTEDGSLEELVNSI
jgi:DNA-directed RNA polymerase specialized sigma24 family protein